MHSSSPPPTQQYAPPDLSLPSAVIFDFDGTILDTEWIEYESWRDIYQTEGVELPIHVWAQCVGSDYDAWSPEAHLESLTNKTYDWPAIHKPRSAFVRNHLETAGPRAGIRAALEYFGKHSIPLAIASSSDHAWVDPWLEKLGLIQYFSHICCSDDVQNCKPAPDLFLKAAQLLNQDPKTCWVIEDSKNGLIGGIKAGAKVIITHHPITAHLDFTGALLVEDSMERVLERIKEQQPSSKE
ncbi:Putative phosphatase YhcW [Seminavis robusta]|uniref:Phosphatase YhcW n=1 Tax=Seminavis robusta TaxID=568900 RepID=A0A9N8DJM9_9STRA|nr:Putative phosphatase YhcW [Seminavis robusta]|eukprot:Sro118_g057630.1 Putative phosphatase YhcW (240) ;mRNA; f:18144-18863